LLTVARLQARILNSIRRVDPEEPCESLSSKLIPVSDLYNDFASSKALYDECLLILDACSSEDASAIRTVWKNIIWDEILPCATIDESTYERLLSFVDDPSYHNGIKLIPTSETAHGQRWIEDGDWVRNLVERVERLGKSLIRVTVILAENVLRYEARATFPVDFLLSQLEGTTTLGKLSEVPYHKN
jgi:hypothetical protein